MNSRKVPLNYRNATGRNGSAKSDYSAAESTLEADFLTLLDFNQDVLKFTCQPVTITCSLDDLRRRYTPDVMVEYTNHKVIFYEVKYRQDLFKNWITLKPKFKVAIKYAKSNNAEFKIITEKEIRTDYLCNIKFLKTYIVAPNINFEKCQFVENILMKLNSSTPNKILNLLTQQNWSRTEGLFILWSLIGMGAQGKNNIKTNLHTPLTMNTEIWWQK